MFLTFVLWVVFTIQFAVKKVQQYIKTFNQSVYDFFPTVFHLQGQIENEVVHEILRIIFEIEDDNDNAPQFEPSDLQGMFELLYALKVSELIVPTLIEKWVVRCQIHEQTQKYLGVSLTYFTSDPDFDHSGQY